MRASPLLAAMAALAGCIALSACSNRHSDLEEATGEGSIRALHAVPELGAVRFLIEETLLASVDYKDVSATSSYDNLSYAFNFDVLLPGDSDYTRIATRELKVVDETEYTFVLTGTLAAPEIVLWDQFGRDWDALLDEADENETEVAILDVSFGHVAQTVADVDLYLSSPGTAPAAGNQAASLAYAGFQDSAEYPAGDYQLVVTPAGDASTYLFASEPFTLSAATSVAFVVMDGDDSITGDFAVRAIGSGSGTELGDIDAVSTLRVVHGAYNTGAVNVVVGDGFDSPLASGVAFGDRTDRLVVDDGELNLNVTPTDNAGVFLAEEHIDLASGARYSLYLNGLPGQLSAVLLRDQTRRLALYARLRLYQAASRFGSLDAYLVAAGSDIALLSPYLSSLAYTGSTNHVSIVPGTYEIYFTLPGTKTIVAGPLHADLEAGNLYDVVTVDTAQTDVADILYFQE